MSAGDPAPHAGRRRLVAIALSAPLLFAGCLSVEPPPAPSEPPATAPVSALPTDGPRDPGTLVVGVERYPVRLLPPASGATGAILDAALYDTLYRLDSTLVPQPLLAAAEPVVSADGLTWTIDLRGTDLAFQDGTPLIADDIAFSLRLAAAPSCSYGRALCDATATALAGVAVNGTTQVAITLNEPDQSFLAEVLAQVPIVSEIDVREAVAQILVGAEGVDPALPADQLARISDQMTADDCLSSSPPFGCRLSDHIADLERTLTTAGLVPPDRGAWTDASDRFDGDRYAADLLDRVAALGRVLAGDPDDQLAAALPLLDPLARPIGSGPWRLAALDPGRTIVLEANERHVGGAPPIGRIELRTVPDPATGATLLATGAIDWLPELDAEGELALAGIDGTVTAARPGDAQAAIVFNVREGRRFDDARTRLAFQRCLDLPGLVSAAAPGTGGAVAGWVAAGSWAMPPRVPPGRDVAAADALLDEAGWVPGADGIRERGGNRLSTTVAVRPGRVDLVTFASAAATQLRDCGIELRTEELDVAGGRLLDQLQWPNDFDTLLLERPMGVDPDQDLAAFEGSHATTEENGADANPGGYADPALDARIAQARETPGRAERAAVYAEIGASLDAGLPAIPLWDEPARAALSTRIRDGDAPPDPTQSRYWWAMSGWRLADPEA